MNALGTAAELESRIGKASDLVHLKTIDHLDEGARGWIAASPLMVAGFGGDAGMSATLGGGAPGWAKTERDRLRLPVAALDVVPAVGASFGSFFMLSSVNELVRVNGKVISVSDEVVVSVQECYFHCGKAMIRSDFWMAQPAASPAGDVVADFALASRFLGLVTVDAQGAADVSPKGDLVGMMARMEGDTLWFCDRPGNKRIDSFRNIITQPRVAAILIAPGATAVMHVQGVARITDDEAIRRQFIARDNVPTVATGIACERVTICKSSALERARLWPAAPAPAEVDVPKVAVGHIKLAKGMKAGMVAAAMSIPGLVEKELAKDYKKNLF